MIYMMEFKEFIRYSILQISVDNLSNIYFYDEYYFPPKFRITTTVCSNHFLAPVCKLLTDCKFSYNLSNINRKIFCDHEISVYFEISNEKLQKKLFLWAIKDDLDK